MDPAYDLYHAHTGYAAQAALYAHHVHAAKKGTQALLLEWGCRTGSLLAQWPRFGWQAVGIEPCLALRKHAWAKGLQVLHGSYYRPPLLDAAPAAAVIPYPVVSYAGLTPARLRRFLRAVRAVLEPGGTVVLDMITIGWRKPAGIGFPGPVGGGVDGVGVGAQAGDARRGGLRGPFCRPGDKLAERCRLGGTGSDWGWPGRWFRPARQLRRLARPTRPVRLFLGRGHGRSAARSAACQAGCHPAGGGSVRGA